jgi:hypothetical protein
MDSNVEGEVTALITAFDGLIPPEQLQDMKDLTSAGEQGIAYENLYTQLFEFDIELSEVQLSSIRKVGLAMGIKPKYWERLNTTDFQR